LVMTGLLECAHILLRSPWSGKGAPTLGLATVQLRLP
jgi:hypothetical protein